MSTTDPSNERAPESPNTRGTTTIYVDPTIRLISAPEAAATLGISERTLWTLTACNAIPSLTIGRRRLYRPCALSAWLDAGAPTAPGSADNLGKGVAR